MEVEEEEEEAMMAGETQNHPLTVIDHTQKDTGIEKTEKEQGNLTCSQETGKKPNYGCFSSCNTCASMGHFTPRTKKKSTCSYPSLTMYGHSTEAEK